MEAAGWIRGTMAALSLLVAVTACRAPELPRSGSPECPSPSSDLDAYGPGYDLIAFRNGSEPRHIEFSDHGVLWVDGRDQALIGPDVDHLKPTGLVIPKGAVIGFDPTAVFWWTPEQALWRGEVGGRPTRLWQTQWELDSLREDRQAFWAELIDCRRCIPHAHQEIWRIPKRGGSPARFYAAAGDLVTNVLGQEDAVYLEVLPRNGPSTALRVPVVDGRAGATTIIGAMPELADERYRYDLRDCNLMRTPMAGGPAAIVSSVPKRPFAVDGTDVYFELGDQLYALRKTGGELRLLADWSTVGAAGDECFTCGTTLDSVCLECESAFYRVPKTPRTLAKRLVRQAGPYLTATDAALYWEDPNEQRIVRRDRKYTADANDDAHDQTVTTIPMGLVSSLVADETFLYYLLSNGSLWRVPQRGGTAVELEAGPRPESDPFGHRPFAGSVAIDGDSIYFLDLVDWPSVDQTQPVRSPPAAVRPRGSDSAHFGRRSSSIPSRSMRR